MAYRRRFRSRRPMQGPRPRRRRTGRSRYRRYNAPVQFRAKRGARIGIPNQMLIKMRDTRTVNMSDPVQTQFALTANSLANLPCPYMEQMKEIYGRYLVCANKITCYWTPESDSPPMFLAVQAVTAVGDEDPPTYEDAMMQSATKVARLPTAGSAVSTRPVLRSYRKSKHVFAVKDLVDNRDYSSVTDPVSSGPTTQWRWAVTVGSVDGLTNVTGLLTVIRDFYIKFYQRRDVFPT